jgi:phosphoribosylformylglycinamidine synthase I
MKIGVVIFPGSNCDRDALDAAHQVLGGAWDGMNATQGSVHPIWHGDHNLPELDLVIVPGGFSYGDYLRSGAMAAHSPIMGEIKKHAAEGRYVIGICNGFQILTESGLLQGALLRNAGLNFICKEVYLRVENATTPFTKHYTKGEVLRVPVAHHDGNYFADEDTLKSLEDNGQVLFRYCESNGIISDGANPNGSQRNIAGISNKKGNVIGMMPHPERVIDTLTGGIDGRKIFTSLLAA